MFVDHAGQTVAVIDRLTGDTREASVCGGSNLVYQPELNPTYNDFAVYYGVGILPARPYHARDKAKVDAKVQVVQRWVLAPLRKRQFFSLAEPTKPLAS